MLAIFLKTLPFFALIGTGWLAGRLRLFSAEATAALTRFVFYFALSALLHGPSDLPVVRVLRYAALVLVAAELVPALLRRWLPQTNTSAGQPARVNA